VNPLVAYIMRRFGASAEAATAAAARMLGGGARVPRQIPVTDMPLASHTKMLIPDYEPAQWEMVKADVGPNGTREQWERPIPEAGSEIRIVDRPAGVSRRAVQDKDGRWVEPRAAVLRFPDE